MIRWSLYRSPGCAGNPLPGVAINWLHLWRAESYRDHQLASSRKTNQAATIFIAAQGIGILGNVLIWALHAGLGANSVVRAEPALRTGRTCAPGEVREKTHHIPLLEWALRYGWHLTY
jgi:hypothetical protein